MGIQLHELVELTTTVWESMIGTDIREERVSPEPEPGRREALLAIAQITGAWRGTVTIHTTRPLARQMAVSMFGRAADEVTAAESCDSLAEIANVICGHVRAASDLPCQGTLPTVVSGETFVVSVCESDLEIRAAFRCGAHPLVVSLYIPSPITTPTARGSGTPRTRR